MERARKLPWRFGAVILIAVLSAGGCGEPGPWRPAEVLRCGANAGLPAGECSYIEPKAAEIKSPVAIQVGRTEALDERLAWYFPAGDFSASAYAGYPRYAIDFETAAYVGANLVRVEIRFANGQLRTVEYADLDHSSVSGYPWRIWIEDRRLLEIGGTIRFVFEPWLRYYIDGENVREQPLPPLTSSRVNALSLAHGADGVIWVGTVREGLLGLKRTGDRIESIHYQGGKIGDPQEYREGPQGNMVTRLASDPNGGLWIGTYLRGLTYFHPGDRPLSRDDDRWAHFVPPPDSSLCSLIPDGETYTIADTALICIVGREFVETITALLPDDRGVWVGTLNGLFYLRHNGNPLGLSTPGWTRVADGVVFSLARSQGRIWVGFSTQVDPSDSTIRFSVRSGSGHAMFTFKLFDPSLWRQARAPLLVVDLNGTPDDPSDDIHSWYDVRSGAIVPRISDTDSNSPTTTFALLSDADHTWIGTDDGLYVARLEADGSLATKQLPPDELFDANILSLAKSPSGAIYLGAFDVCGKDGGALMRLDHHGTRFDPSDDRWTTYTQTDGLDGSNIAAILPLDDRRVVTAGFSLTLTVLAAMGVQQRILDAGCQKYQLPVAPAGVTLLDLGADPSEKSDDTLFQF